MILGIDYGEANIGLALSEGELADPYGSIQNKNLEITVNEIKSVCDKENVDLIIVGISEGKSEERALKFGNQLQEMLRLPVKFVDETLTSVEADSGKRKDKEKIHERSAAVILQRYLDSHE